MARIEGIKRGGSLLTQLIFPLDAGRATREERKTDEFRTLNGVLIFGIMLWALVSYIN